MLRPARGTDVDGLDEDADRADRCRRFASEFAAVHAGQRQPELYPLLVPHVVTYPG